MFNLLHLRLAMSMSTSLLSDMDASSSTTHSVGVQVESSWYQLLESTVLFNEFPPYFVVAREHSGRMYRVETSTYEFTVTRCDFFNHSSRVEGTRVTGTLLVS